MLPVLYGLDDTGLAAGFGAGLGVGVVAGFDAGTAPTDLSRIPSVIALQMAFTPTLLYRSASSLSSTNPTSISIAGDFVCFKTYRPVLILTPRFVNPSAASFAHTLPAAA